MKIQQTKAEKLLRELGVNGSYVGFQYTAYGIIRTMEEPEMIVYVCKGLYVEIAAHFHTTRESAERNIRTVKNVIWKHGDKGKTTRRICCEKTITPYYRESYLDAIEESMVRLVKFLEVFDLFLRR